MYKACSVLTIETFVLHTAVDFWVESEPKHLWRHVSVVLVRPLQDPVHLWMYSSTEMAANLRPSQLSCTLTYV